MFSKLIIASILVVSCLVACIQSAPAESYQRCDTGYQYSVTLGKCVECPRTFTLYKGRCVKIVTKQNVTWVDAAKYCLAQKAQLISANEEYFFGFWQPFAKKFGLNNTNDLTYVGLRAVTWNKWQWLDGTSIDSTGTNWYAGNLASHFVFSALNPGFPVYNPNLYVPDADDYKMASSDFSCAAVQNDLAYSNPIQYIVPVDCNDNITATINVHFACELSKPQNKKDTVAPRRIRAATTLAPKAKACRFDKDCEPGQICENSKTCVCGFGFTFLEKTKKCVRCPKGYFTTDDGCYYLSSKTNKLSWKDALAYCTANSSVLVPVDANQFPEELFEFLKSKKITTLDNVWTGGFVNRTVTPIVWNNLDFSKIPIGNWFSAVQLRQLAKPMYSDPISMFSAVNSVLTGFEGGLIATTAGCLAASSSDLLSSLSCDEKHRFVCKAENLKKYPYLANTVTYVQ